MEINDLKRFSLESMAPQHPRYAVLRDLIPEAFVEEELDSDRLSAALGLDEQARHERYGLMWPGRGEATVALQEPSVATLLPDEASSLRPESARDVVIGLYAVDGAGAVI